jgi:hypothetical protein
MARAGFPGTFCLVEGDHDVRLFNRFFDVLNCRAISSNGLSVVGIVQRLNSTNTAGVLGIIDADFKHLSNEKSPANNILLTDFHDIEIMILDSTAFKRYLTEFGSAGKIQQFCSRFGSSGELFAHFLNACAAIGALRLLNEREKLHLKFDGLDFPRFIDKDSLTADSSKLILAVENNTKRGRLNAPKLLTQIQTIKDACTDLRQLCCGHDFVEIICIGLRRAIGSCDSRIAESGSAGSSLRLAYDSDDFRNTSLFAAIVDWEEANQPYIVLRRAASR